MTSTRKAKAGAVRKIEGVRVELGSGNVFRDLALPNSRLRQAKARLAAQINRIIDDYDWTQVEAAKKLGTHQPIISALQKGRLDGISSERLLSWLGLLNRDIEIQNCYRVPDSRTIARVFDAGPAPAATA